MMVKIHLLGDSLVQTVAKSHGSEFYGTWGDKLHLFFDDKTKIINCAVGGRSSRSFINEGRFYDKGLITKEDFPFGVGPALLNISNGDYVFIQFMCNDDTTRGWAYRPNKQVTLGEPDKNGIYPTVVPCDEMISSTGGWNKGYAEALKNEGHSEEKISALMNSGEKLIEICGDEFFSFDCGATYKGYLKFYIDKVREKGAFPILIISGAKHIFTDGKIKPVPEYHGGYDGYHNYPYVEAMHQIGVEAGVPVIDLFTPEKALYNEIGEEKAAYLHNMNIETSNTQDIDNADVSNAEAENAKWLCEFNRRWEEKDFLSVDETHKNHFGGYFQAALIADGLYGMDILKEHILRTSTEPAEIPDGILDCKDKFLSKLKYLKF